MFPGKLTVKTGTTVTFSMSKDTREVHTATFGPVSYLKRPGATRSQRSGTVPGNAASTRVTRPGRSQLNATSHGNGFANIGALDRDSDNAAHGVRQIKFTQAGTYHFICLIHPFMHGTVVVERRSVRVPGPSARRAPAACSAPAEAPSAGRRPSDRTRSTSTRTVANVGSAAPCSRAPAAVSSRR